MTREEWYVHTTLDHIEALNDYVQIVYDGAIDTDMSFENITKLHDSLCVL